MYIAVLICTQSASWSMVIMYSVDLKSVYCTPNKTCSRLVFKPRDLLANSCIFIDAKYSKTITRPPGLFKKVWN